MEGRLTPLLTALFIVLVTSGAEAQEIPIQKASQCFKSRGIPKVEFNCPDAHMVKINRAFHGIKVPTAGNPYDKCKLSMGQESYNCTYCKGDCMDDSMNLVYDWSTCMGNRSCVRTVMQSYMPTCKKTQKKFSDYLQVEYQCVPQKKVYNICQNLETTLVDGDIGFIQSPNYPYNYPVNQDCLCKLSTQWESRIVLSLVDLLLETKNSRCRADWMMLRQNNQKHRHCGAIMTGVKNITSTGNALAIQFHSDHNDNRTQKFQYFTRSLKGFWMAFVAEPSANIRVHCRPLSPADPEVKEITKDDAEYDEILSTAGPEPTAEPDSLSGDVVPADNKDEGRVSGGRGRGRDKPRHKNGSKHKERLGEKGQQDGTNMQDSSANTRGTSLGLAVLVMTSAVFGTLQQS